jgi:hypothetical protein
MMIYNTEYGLVLAALILVFIHFVVSFTYCFVSFPSASSKSLEKALKKSGWGWIVSSLVCLVVFFLLITVVAYQAIQKQFPCPLQLSLPGGKDRKEVEHFLQDHESSFPKEIYPYQKNRAYLVLTGYYLQKETVPEKYTDTYQKILDMVNKYPFLPVGYVEHGKIFSLSGEEFWPKFDISTLAPSNYF